VRLQDLDDGGEQPGALAIAQRAQCSAADLARKAEGRGQVEPAGVHPRQLGAEHRVEQRHAGPAAGLPTTADVVGEELGHGIRLW
jgi:hypothetical protein